jgi:hypothetical protein
MPDNTAIEGYLLRRLQFDLMPLSLAKAQCIYIKSNTLRDGQSGRRIDSTAQEHNSFGFILHNSTDLQF